MTPPPPCVNHPVSPGIALCVSCRHVLCGVCTTRIQGRNLCVSCLADELGDSDTARPPVGRTFAVAVHLAAGFGLILSVAVLAVFGLALHAVG